METIEDQELELEEDEDLLTTDLSFTLLLFLSFNDYSIVDS